MPKTILVTSQKNINHQPKTFSYHMVQGDEMMWFPINPNYPPSNLTSFWQRLTLFWRDIRQHQHPKHMCKILIDIWMLWQPCMMEVKASWMTSWGAIHSPPWEQQKKWVPVGSKGCLPMQWINLIVKGWGGQLSDNTKEKTYKAKTNMEWLNKQKTMHLHLSLHKTSNSHNANQKPC